MDDVGQGGNGVLAQAVNSDTAATAVDDFQKRLRGSLLGIDGVELVPGTRDNREILRLEKNCMVMMGSACESLSGRLVASMLPVCA